MPAPAPKPDTPHKKAKPHNPPPRQARRGPALQAREGRVLTRGVAQITESAGRWTARLTQLDRPGVIASMYFAEKAREIVLRLDDGRHARARLASTSFIAASERVCDLTGLEPLV